MLGIEWSAGLTGLGLLALVIIGLWLLALVWEKLSGRMADSSLDKYERTRGRGGSGSDVDQL